MWSVQSWNIGGVQMVVWRTGLEIFWATPVIEGDYRKSLRNLWSIHMPESLQYVKSELEWLDWVFTLAKYSRRIRKISFCLLTRQLTVIGLNFVKYTFSMIYSVGGIPFNGFVTSDQIDKFLFMKFVTLHFHWPLRSLVGSALGMQMECWLVSMVYSPTFWRRILRTLVMLGCFWCQSR